MPKKTFILIFGLMAACGVLALVAFKIASTSREQRKNVAVIWTVNADTSDVHQLVFEADGKTLISVGRDIQKWDVATGKLKLKLPKKGNSWLRYSPSGKSYAYGTLKYFTQKEFAQTVNLHDTYSNALLQKFVFPNGNEKMYVSMPEVVFANQGTLFNINYLLRRERPKGWGLIFTEVYTVWDTNTRKQVMSLSREENESTMRNYNQDPFFSPNGRQLWLLETERETDISLIYPAASLKVNLKDLLHDKTVATFNLPDKNSLLYDKWDFACASPKDSLIAAINNNRSVGNSNGTLFVFNLHTQQILWRREADNLDTQALEFSPNGKLLAWCGQDHNKPYSPSYAGKGKLLLLNAQTGYVRYELTERTWLDASKEERISKVEALKGVFGVKPTGSKTPRYLPGDSGTVECLAFSSDGKMLTVGYSSGMIKLWRVPQE